jgi:hypothetical protein
MLWEANSRLILHVVIDLICQQRTSKEARRKRPRFLGEEEEATATATTETRNDDNADGDVDDEEEQEDSAVQARFEGLSIASLRQLARAASVDLSDCMTALNERK